MAQQIQIRRDTAANWTSANPTLARGEFGHEIDTNLLKIGDGTTPWTSLTYYGGGGAVEIDDLNDVTMSTPVSGELLKHDGVEWVNDSIDTTDTGGIPATEKGAANGVATLDGGGLVPLTQMAISGLHYQGTWNANTNTPTLSDATGLEGDYYIIDVEGTQDLGSGSLTYNVGDWIIHNDIRWEKLDHTDLVSSVFSRIGAVVATQDDYTHSQLATIGADDHHNEIHTHVETRTLFAKSDCADNYGDYRVQTIATAGDWRFTFKIPQEAVTITSIKIICIPAGIGVDEDIDLTSDYAAVGEVFNNHSESDLASVYSYTDDQITEFEILTKVFNSVAAGDNCGLYIDHNVLGHSIHYLGILITYTVIV
jgi:hypothetical protein